MADQTSKLAKSFLTFTRQPQPADKLTQAWTVAATTSLGFSLGLVKWWPAWRRYCLFPNRDTVWDAACLAEVAAFLTQQTELQKQDQVRRREARTPIEAAADSFFAPCLTMPRDPVKGLAGKRAMGSLMIPQQYTRTRTRKATK